MILAPLPDSTLRLLVRRAALPEEDVFHRLQEVERALAFGFPRLFISRAEDQDRFREALGPLESRIPMLVLAPADLREWEAAWRAQGLAVTRIDDSVLRLRSLIRRSALTSSWVEGLFADLTLVLGRGLPVELRGLARRVLELPVRYPSLLALEGMTGLSNGALKARFRRRGLPSPARYLRWFRLLAGARFLAETGGTTMAISHSLGFASDGNFCRWVQSTSGLTPSTLRAPGARMILLARLVEECFPEGSLEGWSSLSGLFLRDVA